MQANNSEHILAVVLRSAERVIYAQRNVRREEGKFPGSVIASDSRE
jgi:hypothetical protein